MTRHLQGCQQPVPAASPGAKSAQSFHLVVEGRYANAYWLHVAVPAEAPLRKLDDFLRDIWLECCGHMSAFTIGGRRYAASPMADLQEEGMRAPLGQVLQAGDKFSYEYDYGSTTELALRAVGLREGATKRGAVQLLARNEAPKILCDACKAGRLATQICTECAWKGKGWLCEECATTHECGFDTFLPVVNSPRVGVCAYAG
jgi:hypothetical protein